MELDVSFSTGLNAWLSQLGQSGIRECVLRNMIGYWFDIYKHVSFSLVFMQHNLNVIRSDRNCAQCLHVALIM